MHLLQPHLSEFLGTHCESDPNGYLMYNDAIAHFYTYLKNKNIAIAIETLNNSFFDLLQMVAVRREGITMVLMQGHSRTIHFHNYSYIHGLKLTKSVSSLPPAPAPKALDLSSLRLELPVVPAPKAHCECCSSLPEPATVASPSEPSSPLL